MENEISKEMDEFLDKLHNLCYQYDYEIWPTETINLRNPDDTYPTFTIHGRNGEKVSLIYVDGDGRVK